MLSAEAQKITDEAKRQGKWLYDPSYKRWYSPEDFQHIFHYANANNNFPKTLQIKHPNEGIQAGFKQAADILNGLQIFASQVTEYYKDKK